FCNMRSIHVRNKMDIQILVLIWFQSLCYHDRPQIAAAYSDIDQRADGLPGIAFPAPAGDVLAKPLHLRQDLVHFGHHVLAMYADLAAAAAPYRRLPSDPSVDQR